MAKLPIVDAIIASVYGYFRRAHGVGVSIRMTAEATGLDLARVCDALGFDVGVAGIDNNDEFTRRI